MIPVVAATSQAVIGDRIVGQRAQINNDGNLYLARDVVREYMGTTTYLPEHAVLDGDRLVWRPHREGGYMAPLIEGYDHVGCKGRWL